MLFSDLSIIVRGSSIYLNRNLVDFEINAAEQIMLMYLLTNVSGNQDTAAKYFMLDKSSVARTFQKLEEKGFIERTVNSEDHREKIIVLTEKAESVRSICDSLYTQWHKTMFSGISEEEAAAFVRVTAKIANNIEKNLLEQEK